MVDNSDQHFVLVDRKRTVRQHFGGSVLTIVRNSIILHDHDADMPSEVRDIVLSEREDARRKRKKNEPEYGYNTHIPALYDHLEEHLARRDTNSKPDWIIPILTTYYAVREDKVKEPILKQLS